MRTAIGFNQKRGDQVEVINLRFAETPAHPIAEPNGWLAGAQFGKEDIMSAIELAVMGILGLVVLLLVVRPLVRRVIAPDERALALPLGSPRDGLVAGAAVPSVIDAIQAEPSETAKMIDIAQVQGQVHAQSVQKSANSPTRIRARPFPSSASG